MKKIILYMLITQMTVFHCSNKKKPFQYENPENETIKKKISHTEKRNQLLSEIEKIKKLPGDTRKHKRPFDLRVELEKLKKLEHNKDKKSKKE